MSKSNGMINLDPSVLIIIPYWKKLFLYHEFINQYAKLIDKSHPNFMNIKDYTLEGSSLNRIERIGHRKKGNHYFPNLNSC